MIPFHLSVRLWFLFDASNLTEKSLERPADWGMPSCKTLVKEVAPIEKNKNRSDEGQNSSHTSFIHLGIHCAFIWLLCFVWWQCAVVYRYWLSRFHMGRLTASEPNYMMLKVRSFFWALLIFFNWCVAFSLGAEMLQPHYWCIQFKSLRLAHKFQH